jgi:hypothetical protein
MRERERESISIGGSQDWERVSFYWAGEAGRRFCRRRHIKQWGNKRAEHIKGINK